MTSPVTDSQRAMLAHLRRQREELDKIILMIETLDGTQFGAALGALVRLRMIGIDVGIPMRERHD